MLQKWPSKTRVKTSIYLKTSFHCFISGFHPFPVVTSCVVDVVLCALEGKFSEVLSSCSVLFVCSCQVGLFVLLFFYPTSFYSFLFEQPVLLLFFVVSTVTYFHFYIFSPAVIFSHLFLSNKK